MNGTLALEEVAQQAVGAARPATGSSSPRVRGCRPLNGRPSLGSVGVGMKRRGSVQDPDGTPLGVFSFPVHAAVWGAAGEPNTLGVTQVFPD